MKGIRLEEVMARRAEIIRRSVGIDYAEFESGSYAFDYEGMMEKAGCGLEEVRRIQRESGVGGTPLLELRRVTALARRYAEPGKGARIFLKDEAANPSGSFKARRASLSAWKARQLGFSGVAAATSGNYGAAVASQAAMRGLRCLIVQECYDSRGVGQPEIIEKARKCEDLGAEVLQLTVGPELFSVYLSLLEETGFFNASLYTPFGIAGVESLGAEVAEQCLEAAGRLPDAVVATNAGGGNLTGTARGLIKSGAGRTQVVAASVDLSGLHMASDRDFNRKSFTTGHTGFGIPFSTFPDRSDVPRSAARPLRYLDRYVTVKQGEVFFITEALGRLEGLERGPAGNTSLAAAFSLAREMDRESVIVVQESEYTGAGKHHRAQLSFARRNGIDIRFGDPAEEAAGESIVLPADPSLIRATELEVDGLRRSYLRHALEHRGGAEPSPEDVDFFALELNTGREDVLAMMKEIADRPEKKERKR